MLFVPRLLAPLVLPRRSYSLTNLILLALAVGMACTLTLLWGWEAGLAERRFLLRVWHLVTVGLITFLPGHLLFPHPDLALIHLLNDSPQQLARRLGRKWLVLPVGCFLPALCLIFGEPEFWRNQLADKGLLALESALTLGGMGLLSFTVFVRIGPTAQAWQEGKAGQRLQRWDAEIGKETPIPYGLFPAFFATTWLYLLALAVILGGAALRPIHPLWSLLPALAVFGGASLVTYRLWPRFDRYFYATNGIYYELFHSAGGLLSTERPPVGYETLYWVPMRWRAATWSSLLQLDRRLSLGRLLVVGYVVLWALFWQTVPPQFITGFLLVLILAKNSAVALLMRPAFAPLPFQWSQHAPRDWLIVRFFVNMRWTLPFALSLFLVALLDATFAWQTALGWIALDVFFSALVAGTVTFLTEYRFQKHYA